MRTGVSAPRVVALICARTICFAKTGLGWRWECVRGASGGVSSHCPGANSMSSFKSATRQNYGKFGDQKLAMKAKTDRRIFCYLCCSKIIARGEVQ